MAIIFSTFQIYLHCSGSHSFTGILKFPTICKVVCMGLSQKHSKQDGHPKWDTQHSQERQNKNREESKNRNIACTNEKKKRLNLSLFHKWQWARYRWNQKEARTWSLIIRFSDGSLFKLFVNREIHKLFLNKAKKTD